MNLVGELVLSRNTLVQQLGKAEVREMLDKVDKESMISANIEHLSRVTQDLQMSVLSTRMQPIKKVFDKIPRQVRELKTKLGKEIELLIEGEYTEVDKTLVEELSDPMVHLIRNSLDHGIEKPEVRKAAGKTATGTLAVRAFYEGNNVVIQVEDDGAGINPEKMKQSAIEKGLIDQQQADSMNDEDAIRLILRPGFSTAKEISDVSGRGVGMDVVNSKISDIKGTIDIKSTFGSGTVISIYVPLTLAIMQALLVAANKEGFAIPIGDISEVIKYVPEDTHLVNDNEVIELRGNVLPLFYLHNLTREGVKKTAAQVMADRKAAAEAKAKGAAEGAIEGKVVEGGKADGAIINQLEKNKDMAGYIVVVHEKFGSIGLVVDRLIGQEEAVVKPVSEAFEYHKAVSGATITGDGTVHMILDIPFMIKSMI